MSSPEITIAIVLYNSETYIRQTLLSALDQTFLLPYEVLIVNNCSTDKSVEIINEISATHPRGNNIRILNEPSNLGPGPARNDAIQNAKGKYFFFLDSDDYISSNCLQLLYDKAERTNADFTVGSHEWFDDESGEIKRKVTLPDEVYEHSAVGVKMFVDNVPMQIEMWNILFRTSFLMQHNIHYEHRIMEEYFFDLQLRAEATKVATLSQCTLHYRVHPQSVVTSFAARQITEQEIAMFCDIINRMRQLVEERYSDIDGIYDLYFCRVIWVFENLMRSTLSEAQWKSIGTRIAGFRNFVPQCSSISTIRRRFIYRYAGRDERVAQAIRIVNSPMGRRAFWGLGKLGVR